MSDILDLLAQMFRPPEPPPPPPAGKVTPIVRTSLPDVTDAGYLAEMVTRSSLTEADIDNTVANALTVQAAQDELIEEGGRLIGLRARVEEVRPQPQPQTPPAQQVEPNQPMGIPYA